MAVQALARDTSVRHNLLPTLWLDGDHDDAPALNALLLGYTVLTPEGDLVVSRVDDGRLSPPDEVYHVASPVRLPSDDRVCFNGVLKGIKGYTPELVALP